MPPRATAGRGGAQMTKYHCIVADPPWRYKSNGGRGAAENHYQTMSLVDIAALAPTVKEVAAPDCFLFLWTTSNFLADGSATMICRAWGFEPKQVGVWTKPQLGMGSYLRNTCEYFIVATRGRPRRVAFNVRSNFEAPRGKHSRKPDAFYSIVEKFCTGPRLDMFAREAKSGWDSWGNESPTKTRVAI